MSAPVLFRFRVDPRRPDELLLPDRPDATLTLLLEPDGARQVMQALSAAQPGYIFRMKLPGAEISHEQEIAIAAGKPWKDKPWPNA